MTGTHALDGDIDYEALPTSSHGIHMFAGAMAGISEHAVMFPIDTIKTRMQMLNVSSTTAVYSGMTNAVTKISSSEGLKVLWRGVASVILGAGPAHAIQFGTLEAVKELMGGDHGGDHHWGTTSVAGACSAITSEAVMTPFDVIKQRMQVFNSQYRTVLSCARGIYAHEGLAAFYVSYPTTLVMNIPFLAVQFSVYDHAIQYLNPEKTYQPLKHIISGGIAGGIAAAVTTPVDVAKTLLQTRGTSDDPLIRKAKGLGDAFKIIWQRDGAKGFARGMAPRVLANMPSNAISWASYEAFKMFLRARSGPDSRI